MASACRTDRVFRQSAYPLIPSDGLRYLKGVYMKTWSIGLASILFLSLCVSGYAADCNDGGRYEDNNDGTVTDCRGGLIWLKNANCAGAMSWYDAMNWAAGLGQGICSLNDGSSAGDWRLPTETEWMAMTASAKKQGMDPRLTDGSGVAVWAQGNVFNNVQSSFYWSATTLVADQSRAWCTNLEGLVTSFACYGTKTASSTVYAWPVRDGRIGSYGYLFID
ncbi:MAG: hypothetical protein C0402_09755 [Thermodesulfovibrio sp.]|nr:hypothetical protein [Thermodesulfovibrio sp.]